MKRTFERALFLVLSVLLVGCDTEQILTDLMPDDDSQHVQSAPTMVAPCPPALYKNISRMRYIPRGSVTMGCPNAPAKRFAPEIVLETDAFYMDMHEVTYGDFLVFIEAGYSPDVDICSSRYTKDANFYALPANVSWNDATNYANWVGKRLPTEIEWEKAARAGLSNAMFPWGDSQPSLAPLESQTWVVVQYGPAQRTKLAIEGAFVVHLPSSDVGGRDARYYEYTQKPVGSYAPNAYGLFDMIGNAEEWCSNEWNNNAYLLYANGVEPKWDGRYYLDPYTYVASLCHVVRGGGSVHSIDTYNTWAGKFDTLAEELKYRYARRTIHVGERAARGATEYVGFRLVMEVSDRPEIICRDE